MASYSSSAGLRLGRLLLVLSSISPLFVLWALRGSCLVDDRYFVTACALAIVVPNVFLLWRVRTARQENDVHGIAVGRAEDHRDHILIYLFAMLLPFYAVDLSTWREMWAAVAAIALIVFLFWQLNLHYMNVVFAILGYHIFTVYAPAEGDNPITGRDGVVVITRRAFVGAGDQIEGLRLSDTVYMESA